MKSLLLKSKFFFVVYFLFLISGKVNAQCTITSIPGIPVINSGTLTCGTSPLSTCNGTLIIGDGFTATNINMNWQLDLTCLGVTQMTVKKYSLFDFRPGSYRLYLAEGSSIIFEPGSDLLGGNGSNCSASERIYIGTNLLASCNGGAGADLSFPELLAYGGTGSLASNSPVCIGSQISLTATPPPTSTGTFTYSFSGPGLAATSYSASPTYSFTATAGTTGIYQVKIKNSNIANPLIAEISVSVNSLPAAPTILASGPTTFCEGGSVTLTSSVGSGNLWSTGETTSSISPTTSGSYTVRVTNANGCQSAWSAATVVSVTTIAVPTGAASQSFCFGTSPTVANLTATGSTLKWYSVSSGGSPLSTSAALVDGTHYYASQTVNGCESVTRFDVFVTLNTAPSAPIVPSTLSIGCLATAFVANWAASSSATNYYIDVATDAGFTALLSSHNNKSLGNVISEIVTGLSVGSIFHARLRAENSCGTSPHSATILISIPTTTYNAGSWDNGIPDNTKKAIFASGATITTPLDACSCQINSGVNVVVGVPGALNDTAILKLENGLNVIGSGTLTFENNASLVQVNNAAVNTGAIIYRRNTTPMKNFDFTYWSSPVAGQTLKVLSPNTLFDKYFSYSGGNWVTELNGLSTMTVGKGYIIRVPKPGITYSNGEYWTGATYVQAVQFFGVPNNGVYTLPIDPQGYGNLIGNPYPCALSADAFLLENSINNSRLEGTIYFWTHNTVVTNNKYSGADFASYNYLGGVGTAAVTSGSTGGANTNIPSGFIAAGQSFLTKSASAGGAVVFNNGMRVSLANKNAQFFKGAQSKAVSIEKHRLWLNFTNTEGAFKQILVGYVAGGTNGFDSAFDGVSLDSNKYIDFYSVNNSKDLVIQGRALPFDTTDKVPLGYKTTVEGKFVISIDKVDGVLTNQAVFVEDKIANVIHNLKNGAYSFSTLKGVFNDRFVLRFIANDIVYSTLTAANLDKPVIVSVQNQQIKINSFDKIMDKLLIYDLNGRLLYENEKVNSNEFTIPDFISSKQILIVKTLLVNGEWSTTEIIF